MAVNFAELPREEMPGLPLAWADRMEIHRRGDIPIATLRFYGALADRMCECARIQTTIAHIHQIIDVLCRSTDYYPAKPKP